MRSLELADLVGTASGVRLTLREYQGEFRERQWDADDPLHRDSWKLERQQHFREPGFPSWEAFFRGDWAAALRLVEDERGFLEEFSRQARERGIDLFRLRVVEKPITPYLQWELNFLRLREQCGERIRVVGPERLRSLERPEPLPELVTLGNHTVYQVLYDDQGVLDGAVRFTEPETVERSRQLIRGLYADGEELSSYFAREVAHLPPPRPK